MPEMRVRYLKRSLVAACMLTLWLIASFLSQEFSQNDLHEKARIQSRPESCQCFRSFRKCMCSSEIFECPACLHTPGGSDWFDECFERAVEPVQKSEEPMSSDALILRMNQAPVQGFEMDVGNKTTMRIMYPEMASAQDPGTQLLLLPLNSSGLKWFMEVLREQSFRSPVNPGFQIVQVPGGSNKSKDKVLVISLNFLQYVQHCWLGKHSWFPSLGFVGLLYALHTCDQALMLGDLTPFQLAKEELFS
ncbi:CMP-N-acetylneuraminate-beta-galactosamide-alpha-2,3-sialyltransferase 1-like isoform X2 [Panthera onca]|uniref:CMP-N-acetylneuraminate-beta-galactosamide- alpha-2,3-sialyltransferase 1-like isoform X1 n=1 Tax=Panthera onca TaxID=9690 RepID=UPI002952D875|nr:CMP-N-acetylneuraminate-beta-galactosamide-alpha-2,3-sialyltransferase 1-like isoform X1 [Panthera onca]